LKIVHNKHEMKIKKINIKIEDVLK